MSDEIKTGGPAFPAPDDWKRDSGMTLRDYFAAQALAGWMSGLRGAQAITPEQQDEVAAGMYSMDDAMLIARAA